MNHLVAFNRFRGMAAAFAIATFIASTTFAAESVAASVEVKEPGEWRVFKVGALVASEQTGNGPSTYFKRIPTSLTGKSLEHFFLLPDAEKSSSVDYGRIDFEAKSDGLIWMLTTSRFGGGGESGIWSAEVKTQAKLQSEGWRLVSSDLIYEYGYAAFGANPNQLTGHLFERECRAGEQFSIRTEKYQSPVIVRSMVARLRASMSANGRLALEAAGPAGLYSIQSSTDLTKWTDDLDVTLTGQTFQVIGGTSFSLQRRFYRLALIASAP